jgi:hypothetical protein
MISANAPILLVMDKGGAGKKNRVSRHWFLVQQSEKGKKTHAKI